MSSTPPPGRNSPHPSSFYYVDEPLRRTRQIIEADVRGRQDHFQGPPPAHSQPSGPPHGPLPRPPRRPHRIVTVITAHVAPPPVMQQQPVIRYSAPPPSAAPPRIMPLPPQITNEGLARTLTDKLFRVLEVDLRDALVEALTAIIRRLPDAGLPGLAALFSPYRDDAVLPGDPEGALRLAQGLAGCSTTSLRNFVRTSPGDARRAWFELTGLPPLT